MEVRVLYSVVGGPSLSMIRACATTGQMLHFICCGDDGSFDEFDLNIVGALKNEGVEHELLFSARDSSGLIWSVSYNTVDECGNMFRIFQRSG